MSMPKTSQASWSGRLLRLIKKEGPTAVYHGHWPWADLEAAGGLPVVLQMWVQEEERFVADQQGIPLTAMCGFLLKLEGGACVTSFGHRHLKPDLALPNRLAANSLLFTLIKAKLLPPIIPRAWGDVESVDWLNADVSRATVMFKFDHLYASQAA